MTSTSMTLFLLDVSVTQHFVWSAALTPALGPEAGLVEQRKSTIEIEVTNEF